MLRISAPCAQSLLFPLEGKDTLYQIFINTSAFFQKSEQSATPKDISPFRRKDFCPSGSRCFDEYLVFYYHPT